MYYATLWLQSPVSLNLGHFKVHTFFLYVGGGGGARGGGGSDSYWSYYSTVDPQLSEPRLSELSLIRTPFLGNIMIFIGILLCIK